MIGLEDVEEAILNACDHHNVAIYKHEHLRYGLYTAWGTARGRNYRASIAVVERFTSAQEFDALALAKAIAARLDVKLTPYVLRPDEGV